MNIILYYGCRQVYTADMTYPSGPGHYDLESFDYGLLKRSFHRGSVRREGDQAVLSPTPAAPGKERVGAYSASPLHVSRERARKIKALLDVAASSTLSEGCMTELGLDSQYEFGPATIRSKQDALSPRCGGIDSAIHHHSRNVRTMRLVNNINNNTDASRRSNTVEGNKMSRKDMRKLLDCIQKVEAASDFQQDNLIIKITL